MSSNPSSTYANNGSVKSNGENDRSPPSSSTTSTSTPANTAASNSNLATERIEAFMAGSVDAIPRYTSASVEASFLAHVAAMAAAIEEFDAVMAKEGGEL